MNILDAILSIPLLWGGYQGIKKGFILEFFSIGALLLAMGAGMNLVNKVLFVCTKWFRIESKLFPLFLFILIFIITAMLIIALGHLIKYCVNLTALSGLDAFIGCIMGMIKWAIILSALLWCMNYFEYKIASRYTVDSFLFHIIESLVPSLVQRFYGPVCSLFIMTYDRK